jgi:hypothetical protein
MDGVTWRTCSWCHRLNIIDPVAEQRRYCPDCGHRADVPRLECDCSRCGAGREPGDEVTERAE